MGKTPIDIMDCIETASIAVEKCSLMLDELSTEYTFINRPSTDYNSANSEAQKWLWEYPRIKVIIRIAQDFAFEISNILKEAKRIDDEGGVQGGARNE